MVGGKNVLTADQDYGKHLFLAEIRMDNGINSGLESLKIKIIF